MSALRSLIFLAALPLLAQPTITTTDGTVVKVGQTLQLAGSGVTSWSLTAGSAGSITSGGLYTAPASVVPHNMRMGCMALANDTVYNTRIDSLSVPAYWKTTPDPAFGGVTWYSYLESVYSWDNLYVSMSGDYGISRSAQSNPWTFRFNYTPNNNGTFNAPLRWDWIQEGGRDSDDTNTGDRHTNAIDPVACDALELYKHKWDSSGTPNAQSGWHYGLISWTGGNQQGSTQAASMVMTPLVYTLQEILSGEIKHAVRVAIHPAQIRTANNIWPSQGYASTANGPIPYGSAIRLTQAAYDTIMAGSLPTYAKTVATALRRYGVYLTDATTGQIFDIGLDQRANSYQPVRDAIAQLVASIRGSAFEPVDVSSLQDTGCSAAAVLCNGRVAVSAAPSDFVEVAATGPGGTAKIRLLLQGVAISNDEEVVSVVAGGTKQFSPLVSGSTNTAVSYSATGGTITSGGLFTAPSVSVPTEYRVTITSQADTNVSVVVPVQVFPVSADGGLRCNVGGLSTWSGLTGYTANGAWVDGNGNSWWNDCGETLGPRTYDYARINDWYGFSWPSSGSAWGAAPTHIRGLGAAGDLRYKMYGVTPGLYNLNIYRALPQAVSGPTQMAMHEEFQGVLNTTTTYDWLATTGNTPLQVTSTSHALTVGSDGVLDFHINMVGGPDGSNYGYPFANGWSLTPVLPDRNSGGYVRVFGSVR